jgi:uncharacterized damage-inducible protein DinB
MKRSRVRPAFVADERTQLVGWLDMKRALVHWKCEGFSDHDAHRSVLPSSPLMTMAGVVSHLRWLEHCWFEVLFLGRPAESPQFREELEDADMIVDGLALEQLLRQFEQQCKVSNEIIAAHALDDIGTHLDFDSSAATLRWMLIHMVEEVARHVGQMDIIRELLDGSKGYY